MAKLGRRRVAREVVRLLGEQPGRQKEIILQTAAYLLQTKQAGSAHLLLGDIADELLKTKGHLNADVSTAFGLGDSTRQSVITMLRTQTGAQTVELQEHVTPEILGGIKVRTSQLELDASIKRQLIQLAGGTQ
jgi:F0F1-type ATP synthase delta subunit